MKLKFIKLLMAASVINVCLGTFLIICGILEFTGILETNANTSIESVGVQLSYLVFLSGIWVFASGLLTVLLRKSLYKVNLQMFLGVISLAWPIFVSVSLFFSQYIICIRLLPTMMASLFYMISILIVKIANEELKTKITINPKAFIERVRSTNKTSVDVSQMFVRKDASRQKSSVNIKSIGSLANKVMPKKKTSLGGFANSLFGGRRRSGNPLSAIFYRGSRKRGRRRFR